MTTWHTSAVGRIHAWTQVRRQWIAHTTYIALTAISFTVAILLRFELDWPSEINPSFWSGLPVVIAIRFGYMYLFRLGDGRWRFVDSRDVLRLLKATTAGTFSFYLFATYVPFQPAIPRSVMLIEWVLTMNFIVGVWFVYRIVCARTHRSQDSELDANIRRVLIVGAGEDGSRLAREMCRTPTGYRPVGYIDDDVRKWGALLHGVRVLGPVEAIETTVVDTDAEEIIIAIPSADPEVIRRIVERCQVTDLPVKVLPGITKVLDGGEGLPHLRELRIEDLLGREPVRLEIPELAERIDGKTVLVTGAAGSIGSELARQIAMNAPRHLILLDQAESNLYFVDLELKALHPDLTVTPVIGDILDAQGLQDLFHRYSPDFVYHAAAYKHVPLMEINVREAVRNNIVGTWRVATAAGESGVERFVLISTDKAVRPSSVMGHTKRASEQIVLGCVERYPESAFTAVRFGNVLGSDGSVIPLFQKQIDSGGPVTVTHAEVTRYFMTIPEAAQLVLKASVLSESEGRIAMLEMGSPVRIADLARNLIRLRGLRPDVDIPIVYTGLRPGEKLHEELKSAEEERIPTRIDKVHVFRSDCARSGVVASDFPHWVVEFLELDAEDGELFEMFRRTWDVSYGVAHRNGQGRVDHAGAGRDS